MKLFWALSIVICVVSAHGDQIHLFNDFDPCTARKSQINASYITRFSEREATPIAAQISWYLTGKHRQIENIFRKLYRSTFYGHEEPRVSFLYLRSLEDTTFQEVRVTSDVPASYQILYERSSVSESTTCPHSASLLRELTKRTTRGWGYAFYCRPADHAADIKRV